MSYERKLLRDNLRPKEELAKIREAIRRSQYPAALEIAKNFNRTVESLEEQDREELCEMLMEIAAA